MPSWESWPAGYQLPLGVGRFYEGVGGCPVACSLLHVIDAVYRMASVSKSAPKHGMAWHGMAQRT